MDTSLIDGIVKLIIGIAVPVALYMIQGWMSKNDKLKDIQISKEQADLLKQFALDAWAQAKIELEHRQAKGTLTPGMDQFKLAKETLARTIDTSPNKIASIDVNLIDELQKAKPDATMQDLVMEEGVAAQIIPFTEDKPTIH